MQMDENEAFCSAMNPTLKPPINATSFIIANDTTGRSSVRTTKNSISFTVISCHQGKEPNVKTVLWSWAANDEQTEELDASSGDGDCGCTVQGWAPALQGAKVYFRFICWVHQQKVCRSQQHIQEGLFAGCHVSFYKMVRRLLNPRHERVKIKAPFTQSKRLVSLKKTLTQSCYRSLLPIYSDDCYKLHRIWDR